MSESKKDLDLEVLKKQAEGGDSKALFRAQVSFRGRRHS